MGMRHTVHLKMPKLFGKKKTEEDTNTVVTEIDLKDKENDITAALLVVTPLVVGVGIGYLVGFKAGVNKGGNVIVIKD